MPRLPWAARPCGLLLAVAVAALAEPALSTALAARREGPQAHSSPGCARAQDAPWPPRDVAGGLLEFADCRPKARGAGGGAGGAADGAAGGRGVRLFSVRGPTGTLTARRANGDPRDFLAHGLCASPLRVRTAPPACLPACPPAPAASPAASTAASPAAALPLPGDAARYFRCGVRGGFRLRALYRCPPGALFCPVQRRCRRPQAACDGASGGASEGTGANGRCDHCDGGGTRHQETAGDIDRRPEGLRILDLFLQENYLRSEYSENSRLDLEKIQNHGLNNTGNVNSENKSNSKSSKEDNEGKKGSGLGFENNADQIAVPLSSDNDEECDKKQNKIEHGLPQDILHNTRDGITFNSKVYATEIASSKDKNIGMQYAEVKSGKDVPQSSSKGILKSAPLFDNSRLEGLETIDSSSSKIFDIQSKSEEPKTINLKDNCNQFYYEITNPVGDISVSYENPDAFSNTIYDSTIALDHDVTESGKRQQDRVVFIDDTSSNMKDLEDFTFQDHTIDHYEPSYIALGQNTVNVLEQPNVNNVSDYNTFEYTNSLHDHSDSRNESECSPYLKLLTALKKALDPNKSSTTTDTSLNFQKEIVTENIRDSEKETIAKRQIRSFQQPPGVIFGGTHQEDADRVDINSKNTCPSDSLVLKLLYILVKSLEKALKDGTSIVDENVSHDSSIQNADSLDIVVNIRDYETIPHASELDIFTDNDEYWDFSGGDSITKPETDHSVAFSCDGTAVGSKYPVEEVRKSQMRDIFLSTEGDAQISKRRQKESTALSAAHTTPNDTPNISNLPFTRGLSRSAHSCVGTQCNNDPSRPTVRLQQSEALNREDPQRKQTVHLHVLPMSRSSDSQRKSKPRSQAVGTSVIPNAVRKTAGPRNNRGDTYENVHIPRVGQQGNVQRKHSSGEDDSWNINFEVEEGDQSIGGFEGMSERHKGMEEITPSVVVHMKPFLSLNAPTTSYDNSRLLRTNGQKQMQPMYTGTEHALRNSANTFEAEQEVNKGIATPLFQDNTQMAGGSSNTDVDCWDFPLEELQKAIDPVSVVDILKGNAKNIETKGDTIISITYTEPLLGLNAPNKNYVSEQEGELNKQKEIQHKVSAIPSTIQHSIDKHHNIHNVNIPSPARDTAAHSEDESVQDILFAGVNVQDAQKIIGNGHVKNCNILETTGEKQRISPNLRNWPNENHEDELQRRPTEQKINQSGQPRVGHSLEHNAGISDTQLMNNAHILSQTEGKIQNREISYPRVESNLDISRRVSGTAITDNPIGSHAHMANREAKEMAPIVTVIMKSSEPLNAPTERLDSRHKEKLEPTEEIRAPHDPRHTHETFPSQRAKSTTSAPKQSTDTHHTDAASNGDVCCWNFNFEGDPAVSENSPAGSEHQHNPTISSPTSRTPDRISTFRNGNDNAHSSPPRTRQETNGIGRVAENTRQSERYDAEPLKDESAIKRLALPTPPAREANKRDSGSNDHFTSKGDFKISEMLAALGQNAEKRGAEGDFEKIWASPAEVQRRGQALPPASSGPLEVPPRKGTHDAPGHPPRALLRDETAAHQPPRPENTGQGRSSGVNPDSEIVHETAAFISRLLPKIYASVSTQSKEQVRKGGRENVGAEPALTDCHVMSSPAKPQEQVHSTGLSSDEYAILNLCVEALRDYINKHYRIGESTTR